MEPRISLITLAVADLERSLRFYRDGLGLPTTWTGDKGVVFFQTSGTVLALYPRDSLARDLPPGFELAPANRGGAITLAHNVRDKADVARLTERARAAGATIIKPPHDTFWGGHAAYFTDPDNHLWEIAWGAFDFNEDGSLRVP